MKASVLALVALRASADNTNPLAKVIEKLDGLKAKVTAAGDAEAKANKEFSPWCDDSAANKGFEIKTATAKKEDLTSTIEKSTSDLAEGTSKIAATNKRLSSVPRNSDWSKLSMLLTGQWPSSAVRLRRTPRSPRSTRAT